MTPSSAPVSGLGTQTAALPSQPVRTVVSFLLFLHFFALAVGVTSNVTPSRLEVALRNVPGVRPYVTGLAMDLSYMYHLTYFRPSEPDFAPRDGDHLIEADLTLADGSRRRVVLPGADIALPQRWKRYERLAAFLAGQSDDEELQSKLAQRIAARLLAENGATGGTIRCRRHFPQPMTAPASTDPAVRDPAGEPYFRTVYEARVLLAGDQVMLKKVEAASEEAPPAAGP